jgi:hypothetical protein
MSLMPLDPSHPLFKVMNPGPINPGSIGRPNMGGLGGLFGQVQQGQQQQGGLRGLLSNPDLAMALLANSGYSPHKRGFGEILGTSALQARQMGQQREDDAFKRKYMEAQMQKMLQPEAGNAPNSIQEFEYAKQNGYTGTFEQWRATQGTKAEPPASIQEFNLAKEQGFKGTFFEYVSERAKRSAQYPYSVHDVNGVPTLTPRINPTMPVQPQAPGNAQAPLPTRPLSTLDTEANAKRVLADAGAAGTETGKTTAQAQIDLPRVEDNASQMFKLLDRLEVHPGRKGATGASSALNVDRLPGTNERDFVTSLKQVGGKQFLEAFNTLKGGGAITEVEGAKAETAISTIQDRGQSEEAWLQAVDDLRDVVASGVRRAKRKANAGAAPQTEDPLGIR